MYKHIACGIIFYKPIHKFVVSVVGAIVVVVCVGVGVCVGWGGGCEMNVSYFSDQRKAKQPSYPFLKKSI